MKIKDKLFNYSLWERHEEKLRTVYVCLEYELEVFQYNGMFDAFLVDTKTGTHSNDEELKEKLWNFLLKKPTLESRRKEREQSAFKKFLNKEV